MYKYLLFFYLFFSFQLVFVSNIENNIKTFFEIDSNNQIGRDYRVRRKIDILRKIKKIGSQSFFEEDQSFSEEFKYLLENSKNREESMVCMLAMSGDYYNRTIDLDDSNNSLYSIIMNKNPRKLFVDTYSTSISRQLQQDVLKLKGKDRTEGKKKNNRFKGDKVYVPRSFEKGKNNRFGIIGQ